jgi:hypothetical protein
MNIKTKYLFLFVLLASILTACGAPASTVADPVTIAQGFWDAIHAKNVDAAMAFVADDVVTDGLPAHFTNKADFSAFMLSEVIDDGTILEVADLKLASEDTVTYTMKVDLRGNTEAFSGLGKLQVKDGKIVYLEFP